jgi:hypothetical protein
MLPPSGIVTSIAALQPFPIASTVIFIPPVGAVPEVYVIVPEIVRKDIISIVRLISVTLAVLISTSEE